MDRSRMRLRCAETGLRIFLASGKSKRLFSGDKIKLPGVSVAVVVHNPQSK